MKALKHYWLKQRSRKKEKGKRKNLILLPKTPYPLPLTLLALSLSFLPSNVAFSQQSSSDIGSKNNIAQQQTPAQNNVPIATPALRIIVNSNQDGNVQQDNQLTLREAIELANGTLRVEQLSPAEKALVTPSTTGGSRIEFNLPAGATTIQLQRILPDLASPNLVIDGASQPGYDATKSATAEIAIPIPVVAITPAPNIEIFRGLTVVADGITVRGFFLRHF